MTTSDTDTSAKVGIAYGTREDRMSKIAAEVEAACFTQCAQSGELVGNYKAKLRVLLASIKQQVSDQCCFCMWKLLEIADADHVVR